MTPSGVVGPGQNWPEGWGGGKGVGHNNYLTGKSEKKTQPSGQEGQK